MRRICLAAAFCLLSAAAAAQTPPPPPGAAAPGAALPPGPGRDVVMRVCSKCHDPSIAAEQDLDATGWKELVNQMAANGANGTDEEFAQITDYLAKSFPAK
jgi:competence protein ComEA